MTLPPADYATLDPDSPPPARDAENLRTLAIFHYVLAVMTFLVAGLFLVYLVVGVTVMHQMSTDEVSRLPEGFGARFTPVGIIGLAGGWTLAGLNALSARGLWNHKRRRLSIFVAALNLAWAPAGTGLGIITIAVLMKEPVKKLYEGKQGPTGG